MMTSYTSSAEENIPYLREMEQYIYIYIYLSGIWQHFARMLSNFFKHIQNDELDVTNVSIAVFD